MSKIRPAFLYLLTYNEIMHWLKYLLFSVVFFCFFLIFAIQPVKADDSAFAIDLQTTYTVANTGSTQITHQFTVTNKTPTTFLKEYGLKIHSTSVSDIQVKNNNQVITPTINKQNNVTSVSVVFPDEVAGEGKGRTFSISYTTNDIASVAGRVLEVQIPPLSGDENYASRTIILKTPLQYGRATRVNPQPSNLDIQNQTIVTTFKEPGKSPITAFFGEDQLYKMTLRYNLENTSTSKGLAQIALPPDTPYQRIHVFSIDPPPNDMKVDEDGNWIANYILPPQSTTPVYVTEAAELTLEPNPEVPEIPPDSSDTQAQKFWESGNANIQQIASQNNSPKQIYDYVVKTLSYSYAELEKTTLNRRLGAVDALAQPTAAVCQEFTDTFIALARAAKIPSRRLTGYAYTQNTTLRPLSLEGDILHAWPEFFDTTTNRWHQVDPTWENTTGGIDYFTNFDLSHIVFAINGTSSTNPYPAGSYKGQDLTSKDVSVTFTDTFPQEKPAVMINLIPVKLGSFEVPGAYTLAVTNPTGQAWYDINVEISLSDPAISVHSGQTHLAAILPYQTVKIPVTFTTAGWTLIQKTSISITSTNPKIGTLYESNQEVTASSTILTKIQNPNLIVGMVSGGLILAFGAGSLLVFRRKR